MGYIKTRQNHELKIFAMKRLFIALFALLLCHGATAAPEPQSILEPAKLDLKPFTPETNYMSLSGFLRLRFFLSKNAPQTSTDLTGTTWTGTDLYMGEEYTTFIYTFGQNGILTYGYKGNTYTNGTWQQSGDVVYMETNKKYSERLGLIRDNEMRGVAHNVTGKQWNWSVSK